MTTEPTEPAAGIIAEAVQFHLTNPDIMEDPQPFYRRLRTECPVARSERFGGFWILSKYEDVYRAYHETDLFSSFPNSIPSIGQQRPVIPSEVDPPDHTHYRHILNPLFTQRALKPMEAEIHRMVGDLVDEIAVRGRCEYVNEFGKLVPTRAFLRLLGLPLEDGPMFLEWTEKMLHGVVQGDDEATTRIREETGLLLYGYFAEVLDRRDEAGPPAEGDELDFVDTLRAATFAGERPLSQFEILDIIFIVLLGGLDTTQGVLGFTAEYLAGHDDHRKQIATEPEILDSAVEEFLRWFSPVAPGRRLTRDAVVGGVPMKEGDRVMLLTASASRDEDEFPDSDVVDLWRGGNRHMAFGTGVHRCLGIHLARLELKAALSEWHRRIPDYRITPGTKVRRHTSTVAGIDELHLEWD